MKLLVVTEYFSDPPLYGTAVIAYHWARALRLRGHAVDLLPVREARNPAWDGFYRTHEIGYPPVALPWRPRWRRALGMAAGVPPSLSHVDGRALADRLAAAGCAYDAALIVGPTLLDAADALRERCRVVYVPTDSVSLVLESRLARRGGGLERLRWAAEARMWRRLEADRFPRHDAVVFVAAADAESASRAWPAAPRGRLHVIPNGVDAEHFRPAGVPERPGGMLFTGNLWTHDSVRGAAWFIERVLPRIAEAVPEAVLQLVGRRPDASLRALASSDPRVEVMADVPDVRPYLGAAALYVCPLHSGGGIKNRLLEALAMGKAAVATSACAAALGAEPGRELRVADEPEAFAEAAAELLRDADARRRLGEAGRRLVLGRFTWDAGVRRIEAILGWA